MAGLWLPPATVPVRLTTQAALSRCSQWPGMPFLLPLRTLFVQPCVASETHKSARTKDPAIPTKHCIRKALGIAPHLHACVPRQEPARIALLLRVRRCTADGQPARSPASATTTRGGFTACRYPTMKWGSVRNIREMTGLQRCDCS
jgi:hypothetical protein